MLHLPSTDTVQQFILCWNRTACKAYTFLSIILHLFKSRVTSWLIEWADIYTLTDRSIRKVCGSPFHLIWGISDSETLWWTIISCLMFCCVVTSMIAKITIQGLSLLSGKTSYCQKSRSLGAPRLEVIMIISLRCCRGACQISERLETLYTWMSQLRDISRYCGEISVRLVNRCPGAVGFRQISLAIFTHARHWHRRVLSSFHTSVVLSVRPSVCSSRTTLPL